MDRVLDAMEQFRRNASEKEKQEQLKHLEKNCISDTAIFDDLCQSWYNYSVRKPNSKESKHELLVYAKDGNYFICKYKNEEFVETSTFLTITDIIAWRFLPIPPNF